MTSSLRLDLFRHQVASMLFRLGERIDPWGGDEVVRYTPLGREAATTSTGAGATVTYRSGYWTSDSRA